MAQSEQAPERKAETPGRAGSAKATSLVQTVRVVLDAVADGVLIVEENCTIAEVNAGAAALVGCTERELAGRELAAVLPALAPLLPMARLFVESRARRGIDAEIVRQNRGPIPVHITISESDETQRKRYVLVARDFRAVRSAQQRALQAERLAAIGQTMAALAHESRNALQRMQSCITLLRLRENDEVQDLIDDLQDAQEQLQRLYEEVRNFAAPLRLRLHRIDVHKLLDRTWRQLRVQWAPKEIAWSVTMVPGMATEVQADSTRLGQVFRNILENAIEASSIRGRIAAAFEDTSEDGEEILMITIDDEGPGLTSESRDRAFEMLYTTKHTGTGMGLAIARRIVAEHDGEISLGESDSGGARVRLTLPVARRSIADDD